MSFLTLLGASFGTPATPVVESDLEGLWLLGEGSGESAIDSSGNGRDLQLGSTSGADAADPSWNAEGLEFASGDYFGTIPAAAPLLSDAFTVCVAVKWTSGQIAPLIMWPSAESGAFPGLFAGSAFNNQRPMFWAASGIFAYFEKNDPVDLTDGGWHFLVFSAPGKATTDVPNFKLRADGQDQAVQSSSATGGETSKTRFFVGDYSNNTPGAAWRIAFVSHHSRVLTDGEKDQMRLYASEQLAERVALP